MSQEILFVNKSEGQDGGLDQFEVEDIFRKSDDVRGEIKDAVLRAKDRLYVSWASVDGTDKDNESIPIEDIISNQDTLMERGAPIQDMHTNRHVGRTLSYKILRHPDNGKLGVLHLNKIFNHNPVDNKVWAETVSGKRTGSSVGGHKEGVTYETDPDTGQMRRRLDGFSQYETSSVYSPANPWALNEAVSVVAKSAKDFPQAQEMIVKLESGESFKANVTLEPLENSQESVINKNAQNLNNNRGVLIMEDEVKKKFDELNDKISAVDDIKKSVEELTKSVSALANVKKEETKKEDMEGKEPPKDKEDEEVTESKKEGADPAANAKAPDAPDADEANQTDVFKSDMKKEIAEIKKNHEKEIAALKSEVAEVVKSTRPSESVMKAQKGLSDLAMKIATGEVKKSWTQVQTEVEKISSF